MEVPGVERDKVKIEVKDGVLTLSGEKRTEEKEEENGIFRSERVYGSFSRSFTLPEEVDGEGIEAAYRDGVMTVKLPKKPETTPRLIAIKDATEATQNGDIGVS